MQERRVTAISCRKTVHLKLVKELSITWYTADPFDSHRKSIGKNCSPPMFNDQPTINKRELSETYNQ